MKVTLIRLLDHQKQRHAPDDLGWGFLAENGVELHNVPGDHNTMLHEPNVRILAGKIRECLNK